MKISVIIITRDRKDDMIVTLNGYLKQKYQNKEIIVVDNGSTDGTREMMEKDFPYIKYLWLADNFDIRSINIGIEMSTGDIIWRTDSDSHPESENAFQQAVDIFNKYPEVDIICTDNVEVNQNYTVWEWYPLPIDRNNLSENGYQANIFAGTGAAIRRKVYDKIGGFWEFGFEELDFCTRAIVAGFNVRYFPQIRTLHFASKSDRIHSNRWVKISKQFLRYSWKHLPFSWALGRTFGIIFFQIIVAILSRLSLMTIIEGFFGMLEIVFYTIRNERQPVPKNKLYDITLGVSYFRTQIRYFKQLIIYKINKSRKK